MNYAMKLNEEGQRRLKQGSSISACELLRPDVYTTSPDAYKISSVYLDTKRLNEWKPRDAKQQGRHYCYMYDDSGQDMQDYAMVGTSVKNTIAQSPFTLRHFHSSEIDDSHTGPINKFIFEIDPSKITQNNLRTFWEKIDTNQCGFLTDPILNNVQNTNRNINDKNILKNRLKNTIIPLRQEVTDLNNDVFQEEVKRDQWLENVSSYTNVFNDAKIREESEKNILETRRATLGFVESEWSSCKPNKNKCLDELEILKENVTEETKWNNDLENERRARREEDAKKRRKLEEINVNRNKCSALLEENTRRKKNLQDFLDAVSKQYTGCDSERTVVYEDMLKTQTKLANMKMLENSCLDEQQVLKNDRKTCLQQSQKCNFLKDSFQQVKTIRDRYERELELCNNRIVEKESTRESLQKHNLSHYNELQNTKIAYQQALLEARDAENSESKSLYDKLAGDFDNVVLKATEDAAKIQGCASKSKAAGEIQRIESENARLKFLIESLDSDSCKYCVPSLQQCSSRFLNDPALCGNTQYQYNRPLVDAKKSPVMIDNGQPNNPTPISIPPGSITKGNFNYTPSKLIDNSNRTSVQPQNKPPVNTGPGGGMCVVS